MTDEEIIALYFSRDEGAIRETGAKYGRYCLTIAKNILFSHEDSEECVNDTYLETWNAIPPKNPFSLKAFVGRLTRNNAINRFEMNRAAKRGGGESPACIEELAECVSGRDELTEQEDYRFLVSCLNSFLGGLKIEQRIIFLHRYWYGRSIDTISLTMGISESKVKTTLSRLRNKLKTYLAKEGIHL